MQLRTFLHNMLGTWWSMWPSMCKTPWGSILTLLSKKGKEICMLSLAFLYIRHSLVSNSLTE